MYIFTEIYPLSYHDCVDIIKTKYTTYLCNWISFETLVRIFQIKDSQPNLPLPQDTNSHASTKIAALKRQSAPAAVHVTERPFTNWGQQLEQLKQRNSRSVTKQA
ncbi:unnamed protein product, partial [Vitis vinifera]